MSRCSVKNCNANDSKVYRMPASTQEDRFLKWLGACGNVDLLKLPLKTLQRKSVCSQHFERRFILQKHLSRTAVPTLNLPEPIDASSYFSMCQNEEPPCNTDHVYTQTSMLPKTVDSSTTNSSSEMSSTPLPKPISTIIVGTDCKVTQNLKKKQKKRKYESLLKLFMVTRKRSLSLRDKEAYAVIVNLTSKIRRLESKIAEYKNRLLDAKRCANNNLYNIFQRLPKATQQLAASNIRNLDKSKYARHFTTDDKLFALSLLKKSSPSIYRFLSELFILPSEETLKKFMFHTV